MRVFLFALLLAGALPPCSFAQHSEPEEKSGMLRQQEFLQHLYYPDDPADPRTMQDILAEKRKMPAESASAPDCATGWRNIGPFVMTDIPPFKTYSGRVTDLEITNTGNNLRVLSASGGLWEFVFVFPVPLSDNLNCSWGGSFATDPFNDDVIWLGTGEWGIHAGTGLWKTTNRGESWDFVSMPVLPGFFGQIVIDPTESNTVHCATSNGYWKTVDGGNSWTGHWQGFFVSDIVMAGNNPNVLYAGVEGLGIFKSTNAGDSWTPVWSFSGTSKITLAICKVDPNRLYAQISKGADNAPFGVYRSITGGTVWNPCYSNNGEPIKDISWGNGWYNNIVGICPTDCDLVLIGGGPLLRSTDGINFAEVDANHADQHAVVWNPAGTKAYVGNDGGIAVSQDGSGASFQAGNINGIPITQFINVQASRNEPGRVIGGGTQDNDCPIRVDGNWRTSGGDGGGVAINPFDAFRVMKTDGLWSSGLLWQPSFSSNGGVNWEPRTTGIALNQQWFSEMRNDFYNPPYYFTNSGQYVYRTTNEGQNWVQYGGDTELGIVGPLRVSNGDPANLYAVKNDGSTNERLWVFDRFDQVWHKRFPSNHHLNKVVPDIYIEDRAYAITAGTGAPGEKIFRTDDRGINWTNISGNLPNVPVTGLLANPFNENILYVATAVGAYKTVNGGALWESWDCGLPNYVEMTDLDYIDSTGINGKFYILASTYGRGLWIRDASDAGEPIVQVQDAAAENAPFLAGEPMPNPAASETRFNLKIAQSVDLGAVIVDALGQEVRQVFQKTYQPGNYTVTIRIDDLPAGLYYLQLTAGDVCITRKIAVQR